MNAGAEALRVRSKLGASWRGSTRKGSTYSTTGTMVGATWITSSSALGVYSWWKPRH